MSHHTARTYTDINALPDPNYFDGRTLKIYSPYPSNQMYTAWGNGTSWVAASPVHVGIWANLPAASAVLVGGIAIITDQANAHYVSNGNQWVNIMTTGQAVAISRGFAYT